MVLAFRIDVVLARFECGFGIQDCCDFDMFCVWFGRSSLAQFWRGLRMVLVLKIDVVLACDFGIQQCCDIGVFCVWFWRSRLMQFWRDLIVVLVLNIGVGLA